MFNKNFYIDTTFDSAYSNLTVTEKRAPTDESVKLLREMEEASKKEVIKSISVGGNGFDCVIHVFLDALSDTTKARAVFELNGVKQVATAELANWKYSEAELVNLLRDEVAKVIATEMLIKAWPRKFK